MLVTVGEFRVSTVSGSGIAGVLLNVYTMNYSKPFGEMTTYIVEDMPFATDADADAYCLARGFVVRQ